MKYRVVFERRSRSDGEASAINPGTRLDEEVPDGVVADKAFVQWFESEAQHSQDALDEDDAFLGFASAEVWDYDVVDDKSDEFEDAIARSKVVLEFTVVDEMQTTADDSTQEPEPEAALPIRAAHREGLERPVSRTGANSQEYGEGPDDLTVMEADDPRLGLGKTDSSDGTAPVRRGVRIKSVSAKGD